MTRKALSDHATRDSRVVGLEAHVNDKGGIAC